MKLECPLIWCEKAKLILVCLQGLTRGLDTTTMAKRGFILCSLAQQIFWWNLSFVAQIRYLKKKTLKYLPRGFAEFQHTKKHYRTYIITLRSSSSVIWNLFVNLHFIRKYNCAHYFLNITLGTFVAHASGCYTMKVSIQGYLQQIL